MTERAPYDASFDLGGLPGLDAPLDAMAGDALFDDVLSLGPPRAPVRPPASPPPPPPTPLPPLAPQPPPVAAPTAYPPAAEPEQQAPPQQPPRPTGTPGRGSANPVRRLVPLLVIGWLLLSFGRGLWSSVSRDAGSSGTAQVTERVEPVPVDEQTRATGYNGPEAVPADEVILGTGLPNSADAVSIRIGGSATTRAHYVAYGDGEVIDEADTRGDYSLLVGFDDYQTIVVETDGGGSGCAVFIDKTLVATSAELLEGRCVFDTEAIANALPGE